MTAASAKGCGHNLMQMEVSRQVEYLMKDTNILDEIDKLIGSDEIPQKQCCDALETLDLTSNCFDGRTIPQTTALPTKPTPNAQLYSVENCQLIPITSLSGLIKSGVYKKVDGHSDSQLNTPVVEPVTNVFLTDFGPGRIINSRDFDKHYVRVENNGEQRELFTEAQVQQMHQKNCCANTTDTPEKCCKCSEQWDELSKLAHNIYKLSREDHIVIDRNRNEIVRTENGTNQKTIYRIMSPESLFEDEPTKEVDGSRRADANRPGRPRKRPLLDEADKKLAAVKPTEATAINVPAIEAALKPNELRTRSGRVVKLSRPLCPIAPAPPNVGDQFESPDDSLRNLIADLKDNNYNGKIAKKAAPTVAMTAAAKELSSESEPNESEPTPKRRIPHGSKCPTCQKIFLGRRLQRHYIQHPDHMPIVSKNPPAEVLENTGTPQPQPQVPPDSCSDNGELTLFRFLVSKLQKSHLNEDQKADLFLQEINDLVEQIQMRSSRLIRNTSGLHMVSARTARILAIPEGQYALDMSAIEAQLPDTEHDAHSSQHFDNETDRSVPLVTGRSLDYTAISMDDTLTDEAMQKLNLSAGGKLLPPSEETLLRVVDDLVPDGMAKMSPTHLLIQTEKGPPAGSLVPNYEHANDNAVEAVTMKETQTASAVNSHNATQSTPLLDLAVDFFQFNKT